MRLGGLRVGLGIGALTVMLLVAVGSASAHPERLAFFPDGSVGSVPPCAPRPTRSSRSARRTEAADQALLQVQEALREAPPSPAPAQEGGRQHQPLGPETLQQRRTPSWCARAGSPFLKPGEKIPFTVAWHAKDGEPARRGLRGRVRCGSRGNVEVWLTIPLTHAPSSRSAGAPTRSTGSTRCSRSTTSRGCPSR